MSSDADNQGDDERTDPHILAPKNDRPAATPAAPVRPAAPAMPPRISGIPPRPLAGTSTTIGAMPRMPARPSDPAMRMTDPARPPILPLRAPPSVAPASTAAYVAPLGDRPSDMPPTSSLTAAMLIPRPSSPPPAGRVSDPGGDPLRERVAQVEVHSTATRSIATRIESETARANTRIDSLDPRLASLEGALRERTAQLETAIESTKKALVARVEDMLSMGPRPTAPMLEGESLELGPMKTALATLRATVAEHERQFEARRARVESIETRVSSVESDPRLVEVRRATESFDLRLRALELAQEAMSADVDARLRTMEARLAEAAIAGTTKKLAAPEPEIRRIKGVGPKYEKALREIGITTIEQVATISDEDLGRVAALLSVPVERVRKLGWPDLARALLAG